MLHHGDCLEVLKKIPDNSVDAVVTDPPYGLAFMGKKWDYDLPSVEVWREALRVLKPGGHLLSFGGTRTYHRLVVAIEDAGFEIRDQLQWIYGSGFPKSHNLGGDHEGWGTALKPANEPICLARKPLEKGLTVAENVQKWGTGALNVNASRIGVEARTQLSGKGSNANCFGKFGPGEIKTVSGRWPANVILDEEAAAVLDEQSGEMKSGASRFFYVAKASKRDRGAGNSHPTVKPVKLMEYLIKLVTPPCGVVLDPFLGSGTTGVAAETLGFSFIGIEREEDYLKIAQERINLTCNSHTRDHRGHA